jgi:MOSC domain-containing protein YiiM
MRSPAPAIHSIYIGQPKTITDSTGTYRSSILRDRAEGPAEITLDGFKGDKSAHPYHGGSDQAVCCHFIDHYHFWNSSYGLSLQPGGVGENLCLEHIREAELCIGDIYQAGTARLQVSAPRAPCSTQARRVGRSDWVKLTIQELRTGIYMRVIEPGTTQAGDPFQLIERVHEKGSIQALNRCHYHEFDPDTALMFAEMRELSADWRAKFAGRLG